MEIRARSLTRGFPAAGRLGRLTGGRRRRLAVRGVDFAVAEGEVVALSGENGSGKSTTLRLLAGLLAPDSGEALLGGAPSRRPEARYGLGYAGEADRFPPGLCVGEFLVYAARLSGLARSDAQNEARLAAAKFDLDSWWDVLLAHCSRGIRRRTSLAAALVGEPRALILDEPFTGFDPVARERSLNAVSAAADAGAAVLVSLHDASVIEALAHRLVLLRDGAVMDDRPSSAFINTAAVQGRDWLARVLSNDASNTDDDDE